jgi:hypothetical protein
MAYGKLGQTENAQADLEQAKAMIEGKFSSPLERENEGLWYDWVSARDLLREATNKD